MPLIQFTEKDILRSKVVTPGYYRCRIDGAGQKPAKDGGSMNYLMEATVLFNADDGSKEFAGVPIDWNFNSKAMGFMVGFFAALGAEVNTSSRLNTDNAVGRELDIFIDNQMWEGTMRNRVTHKYRAPKTGE